MKQLSSPADPKNPPTLNLSSDNKFSISGSVIVPAEKPATVTTTPATTQVEAPAPITKSIVLNFSTFTWLLPPIAPPVAPSKPKSKTTPSKTAQKTK